MDGRSAQRADRGRWSRRRRHPAPPSPRSSWAGPAGPGPRQPGDLGELLHNTYNYTHITPSPQGRTWSGRRQRGTLRHRSDRMSWDFSTEPEFAERLAWARTFLEEEILPLETLHLDHAAFRRL